MNAFTRLFRPASPITTLLLLSALGLPAAHAERADRDKPVNLEAGRVTVDDVKQIHVYENNVILTQGTLVIRTERLVVTQDAEGFQKGVATGGPGGMATFRQKREGKDEYVDGKADRIEYDARTEKAQLFTRAYVKSGLDEVSGHYISYDGMTEQYLVTSAPGVNGANDGRVHAVIQPKNVRNAPPAPEAATPR
jgi:lipopolysaccharide export system protein LptA